MGVWPVSSLTEGFRAWFKALLSCLGILRYLEQGALHFHFGQGPTNYVAGFA